MKRRVNKNRIADFEKRKIDFESILILSSFLLFFFFSPFSVISADEILCIECHDIPEKDKNMNYVHRGIDCVDCHSDISFSEDPHTRSKLSSRQICGNCHTREYELLQKSVHGKKKSAFKSYALECSDCHGNHLIIKEDEKKVSAMRVKIPSICAECHNSVKFVEVSGGVYSRKVYVQYENSVHGESFGKGVLAAAICTDCHGAHNIRNPADYKSTVARNSIAQTCGNCHYGIFIKYKKSIHYAALQKGISRSPVCTDCHGIHTITSIENGSDSVIDAERKIVFDSCVRCHDDVRLSKEYQVAPQRVSSYLQSYHGLAARQGETTVADCGSCHGVHMVLPSSNPESYVNKNNLSTTCGKCHPKASENFASGVIHITKTQSGGNDSEKILFYIKWIYIFLIIVTISGMFIHNFLDFIQKMKLHFQGKLHSEKRSEVFYERLNLNERIQHFFLLISFIFLVVTGFALVFPDSWWTLPFRIIEGGASLRGLIHRIAAVFLMGTALYHIYFITATERGRFELRSMLPSDKDLKDMLANFAFLIGLKNEKPKYDRFNYIEKSEYWALIWGTAVMVITGLILWFEEETLLFFPKIVIDIAELVHYYEAWLATLAIIVWHIYYVVLNPSVYPMNWCWLTGKISLDEMKEEHPIELEKREELIHIQETG
ncbi:MAG: cytochrome B [Candidatus Schekmanbacteria bacterium]|nr:MAG: cytochrome B [Candidatus Schekmanbacteria bacterium]